MSLPFLFIIIATFALSGFAAMRVRSMVARYSRQPNSAGMSGADAAARILDAAGIRDVEIREHNEILGDHYDPIHKRLVLSSDNFHGTSTAAVGIAAHECGHAIQHKAAYGPLQMRMAAVGLTGYANQIVMWLPILGIMTGFIKPYVGLTIMAIAWGVIMVFNLITLPVEFDASRRAKLILGNMGIIRTEEEKIGVNKVLDAAALTYVAAFITSLAFFLWHLLPLLLGRRSD
jgi:Zn-dependent membrane protease YugP